MLHVSQKNGTDCGIATAAMIAGVTYEEASSKCASSSFTTQGLEFAEMRHLLERITRIRWRIKWQWWIRPLSYFQLLDEPAAILLQGDHYGHWVAGKGGIIHDPAFASAFTLGRYPRRQWKVVLQVKPIKAGELLIHHRRRRLQIIQELKILHAGEQTYPPLEPLVS